ncbi:MAG: MG2 domain-containing protein, partial [Candidatus Eremiobacterota bacterium]
MRLNRLLYPIPVLLLLASLIPRVDRQETLVMVPESLSPGAPAAVRVVVRDIHTRQPLAGARVEIALNGRPVSIARTDPMGSTEAPWTVPDLRPGTAHLTIRVTSVLGSDRLSRTVRIEPAIRALLTTDRPLYQPGQVVHMRVLALDRQSGRAVESGAVRLEAFDPRGTRVFRQTAPLGQFGVASADLPLAEEVLQGEYRLVCTAEERTTERTIRVERYSPPKFRVEVETERPAYRSGDTLRGTVRARYFFGKPVQDGTVALELSTFDVAFNTVALVQGRTGADGCFPFEVPLPDYFVGLPLEQGKGILRLEASVVDGAGHPEKAARMLQVGTSPEQLAPPPEAALPGGPRVRLDLIPESPSPVPSLPNRFFVATTQHGGEPAAGCRVRVRCGSQQVEGTTDRSGLAEVEFVPDSYQVDVQAFQGQERLARHTFPVNCSGSLLLRTDRSLCRVGDTLKVSVLCAGTGTVFLDVTREGQTVLTRTVPHEGAEIELTPDLAGTLELHAYRLDGPDLAVRDTRSVLVRHADQLQVKVQPGRSEYRPGDTARLDFRVTDGQGSPVRAALGLQVADESLLALAEQHPGLERLYFALQERLLNPSLEVCHGNRAVRPATLALDGSDQDVQRAARALYAALQRRQFAPSPYNLWVEKSRFVHNVRDRLVGWGVMTLLLMVAALAIRRLGWRAVTLLGVGPLLL